MKWNKAALKGLLVSGALILAVGCTVYTAPPPPGPPPPPRPGWVWVQGHWEGMGPDRHWVPGMWVAPAPVPLPPPAPGPGPAPRPY